MASADLEPKYSQLSVEGDARVNCSFVGLGLGVRGRQVRLVSDRRRTPLARWQPSPLLGDGRQLGGPRLRPQEASPGGSATVWEIGMALASTYSFPALIASSPVTRPRTGSTRTARSAREASCPSDALAQRLRCQSHWSCCFD